MSAHGAHVLRKHEGKMRLLMKVRVLCRGPMYYGTLHGMLVMIEELLDF